MRVVIEGDFFHAMRSDDSSWQAGDPATRGPRYGPYTVERPLGRGGSATVYAARDTKHDRWVALKVLSPEVSSRTDSERFSREVRLAARLQHPHVCPVYDSGETDGQLWFTMPLVNGETLRARLAREPRPPLAFVRRVIREAASGLDAAHAAGVVHRDVKPENLLLTTDGVTIVADFGIARATGDSISEGNPGQALTVTGTLLGTPAYMSPEQLDHPTRIGPATDQYALALVAYEMLAGAHPYARPDGRAPGLLRSMDAPPPLASRRRGVSSAEAALSRALRPDPDERFPDISAFALALDEALRSSESADVQLAEPVMGHRLRTVGAVALVAVTAVGASLWLKGSNPPPRPVVAVLPFERVGSALDPTVAIGVSDAVRFRLSTSPQIDMMPRSSSMTVAQGGGTLASMARELAATYLLTGTVQMAPGDSQLTILSELVRVKDGTARSIWSDRLVGRRRDAFALQEQVATRVSEELHATVRGAVDSARSVGTKSLGAYQAYTRGENESQSGTLADPGGLDGAIRAYEEAVQIDRQFGRAWAHLAWARAFQLVTNPDSARIAHARLAVDSANRYAPDDPFTTHAESILERNTNGPTRALAIAKAGITRHPRDAMLSAQVATVYQFMGQLDSAQKYADRARAIDPISPGVLNRVAMLANERRRYETTEAVTALALAKEPRNAGLHLHRVLGAMGRGDTAAARTLLEDAISVFPEDQRNRIAAVLIGNEPIPWVAGAAERRRVLAADSTTFTPPGRQWLLRADIALVEGDTAAAQAIARRVTGDAERGSPMLLALAGRCPAVRRTAAMVRARLSQLGGGGGLYELAKALTWCGDAAPATEMLSATLSRPGRVSTRWIALDPAFAPLRTTPSFRALLDDRSTPRP